MKNHEDSQEQIPESSENEVDPSELSDEELDETSGGIIIVGGKYAAYKANSRFNQVALNPQPLPPKTFNIGGQH